MIDYGRFMIEFRANAYVWTQVRDELRQRILGGTYRPGQVVPSETTLVQEFGVARNTIRKAIAALREEGLIMTVPHLGSFVSERPAPGPSDPEG
ncbi:winged helix-turn-helix domain-containing protein [Nonomuraea pusilla]|uniref:Regulatory protein, gntR family n=1 Tax=Nonomuraea pusilla TaxID=46177 RepID=A0A1H8KFK5_9ACTN|nr:winged helix-turn-helix domain-containing protein [Nonomuraea pusilla]SEN91376.1 regulatory protein, gntR family [Nonomuraea pusilla]